MYVCYVGGMLYLDVCFLHSNSPWGTHCQCFLDVREEEHNYRSLASGMWQATERIPLLSVVASAYTHSPQGVNSRSPGL